MTRKDTFLLPHPGLIRVLELLASGKTAAAIGREMFLSLDAVKSRQRHIYAQLGAHNAAHAVAVAIRQGLIAVPGWPPQAWVVINDRRETSDVLYLGESRAKQAAIGGFLDGGISDVAFDWIPSLGGLLGEQELRHNGELTRWRVAVQIWADAPRSEHVA